MQSLELYPGIISNPDILGGKPVIRGSRVPVALVLGQLASGVGAAEIAREYDITIEDIHAALGYAAQQVAHDSFYATR